MVRQLRKGPGTEHATIRRVAKQRGVGTDRTDRMLPRHLGPRQRADRRVRRRGGTPQDERTGWSVPGSARETFDDDLGGDAGDKGVRGDVLVDHRAAITTAPAPTVTPGSSDGACADPRPFLDRDGTVERVPGSACAAGRAGATSSGSSPRDRARARPDRDDVVELDRAADVDQHVLDRPISRCWIGPLPYQRGTPKIDAPGPSFQPRGRSSRDRVRVKAKSGSRPHEPATSAEPSAATATAPSPAPRRGRRDQPPARCFSTSSLIVSTWVRAPRSSGRQHACRTTPRGRASG